MTNPDLFEYLDARKYLNDVYLFRKNVEPGFSYESWAEELGFRSRSYLRMSLIGKRKISAELTKRFATIKSFNERERKYFESLVRYTQAETMAERDLFGRALIEILKTVQNREEISDSIEFLSIPLHARLLVLIGMSDIAPTVDTLARLMSVNKDELSASLCLLKKIGLATESIIDGLPHFTATKRNFDVPDGVGSTSIMRFHELSLKESIEAFHAPKQLRRFKSLILPLTDSELTEVIANVEVFIASQLAKYRTDSFQDRRIFQLNLNVVPVSRSADEVRESAEQ